MKIHGWSFGSRRGAPHDPKRLAEFDQLCQKVGAPLRSQLESVKRGEGRKYRDNIMPESARKSLLAASEYFTISSALIVRIGALGCAMTINSWLPDLLSTGWMPERIPRMRPRPTPAWRRYEALCEQHSMSWDEFTYNKTGWLLASFSTEEFDIIDRAACAYGVGRGRIITLGVVHMVRTWEASHGTRVEVERGGAEDHPEVGGDGIPS